MGLFVCRAFYRDRCVWDPVRRIHGMRSEEQIARVERAETSARR